MLPAQPNHSLLDALACLQFIASSRQPIGGRALAAELGLEVTRTNRLLKTLAHAGLLRQDERRRYLPGPGIHVLAAQALFGSGLLNRALPTLAGLHELGYIVALGVLWRDRVAYLYHAEPGLGPAQAVGRMALYPAADSGVGLALLAGLPGEQVRKTLGEQASDEVLGRLEQAAQGGYALSGPRAEVGQAVPPAETPRRSLGVALPDGEAALAISGRFRENEIPALAQRLATAAKAIANAEAL